MNLLLFLVLSASPPVNNYRVEILRVSDGDTVVGNVYLGFQVALTAQPIRLSGFDAWEISRVRKTVKITDEEITKGIQAKAALLWLVTEHAGRVYLRPEGSGRGAYNRLTGFLIIYPKNGEPILVDEYMRSRGFDRGTENDE